MKDLIIDRKKTLSEYNPCCKLARTWLALENALASDVNRGAEAREVLDQADAIFQELGAKLDLEQIDAINEQLASERMTPFWKRREADV